MKKYKIIYADPPWWEGNSISAKRTGQATRHFLQLKTKQLCSLLIQDYVDQNCALFLWTTSRHAPDGLKVIKAWGFRFVKIVFTWMKISKSGTVRMGTGYYTKSNSEYVLLGIKEKMPPIKQNVPEGLLSQREKVYKKPDEIRHRIEQLYGDVSRIELFAREKTTGWDVWGNEIKSDIIL